MGVTFSFDLESEPAIELRIRYRDRLKAVLNANLSGRATSDARSPVPADGGKNKLISRRRAVTARLDLAGSQSLRQS